MAVAVGKQVVRELDVRMIRLDDIKANNNIREVDRKSERFKELVLSIKERGVLEPVVVRPSPAGAAWKQPFQLVCGYWRQEAALEAELEGIPARVETLDDVQVIEVQLIENLQREDLSEIDEAKAFRTYLNATKAKVTDLAKKIGKSQAYVSNRMRLLDLHPEVQKMISEDKLSPSHGELLLRIPKEMGGSQLSIAKAAVDGESTVEEIEWEVDDLVREHETKKKFEAKLEAAGRFRHCPKCKNADAVRVSYAENLVCRANHEWDPKTGKMVKRGGSIGSGSSSFNAPPAPPPVLESGILRSPHDARALLDAVLEDIAAEDIAAVYVDQGGSMRIDLAQKVKLPIEEVTFGPVAYSTGHQSAVVVATWGGDSAARRKKRKEAFAKWEKKALKPRAINGKAKVVDAKILDNDKVSEIYPRLERLDLEMLEGLRAAEVKGQKRSNVLSQIDMRLRL